MEMSDTLARAHDPAEFERLVASLDTMANEAVDSDSPPGREVPARAPSDDDLERLIAETLGVARTRSFTVPPEERTVRSPVRPALEAIPAAAPPPGAVREIGPPVEPLALARGRRPGRLVLLAALPAAALAGGWWLAAGGLADLGLPSPFGARPGGQRVAPVIAAAPISAVPVAPTPAAVAPSPAPAATPAPVPAVAPPVRPPAPAAAAPAPPPPAPAPPVAAAAPPRSDTPVSAISAAENAGILGKVESSPFDQVTAPRPVRTTAVIPPTTVAAEPAARPIDFDDPATWPAGAQRGEPHPLPPRRR